MKPYIIPLPKDSLIFTALERIDYEDAFAIKVVSEQPIRPEQLMVLFFTSFPKWFMLLMGLREVIAGWIGLKTAHGMDVAEQLRNFKGEEGEAIALFEVLKRNEEELMTGENDSHLDFRLSFMTRPAGEATEIALITTVQFNNWVGRTYFTPVKPIHRLIVPILLKRMAKKLSQPRNISLASNPH